ncbi:DUF262 domain-containing protein [Serratia rubidaea]|uniref:DUF262 domain-containing protein n=1 Tax=Serratia rubidaea TaxID=61652 RepID=UPI00234BA442|nr:DUF262 domain-containing protein [Serratia rubidaea]MDC6120858.1 DUF262 domain-containing protein [Serratia rubidaea]
MTDDWDLIQIEDVEDEQDISVYQISSYPADITLKGYLDKWEAKQMLVPEFQRNYVWDQVKASKLIESFLLGLPVPGVFLYKNRGSNKLSVIDGQQRIISAIRFFKNEFNEKIFRLKNVHPKWNGKTYEELEENDRFQLDDTVLRATVVQQLDPYDDSSIYHIFERLNTGGMNLNPMEIRRCVYFGEFLSLLDTLNDNKEWRQIIGKDAPDNRLRDVELLLRVVTLYIHWNNYEKPMKKFLNKLLIEVNKIQPNEKDNFLKNVASRFNKTCSLINRELGDRPFHLRGRINFAVLDSVFSTLMNTDGACENLKNKFENLIKDENYLQAVSVSTSDEKVVKQRFEIAHSILLG